MSDIAIRADGLSKQYRIGTRVQHYKTVRDALSGMVSPQLRRQRRAARANGFIWAVRDVSFEVVPGETVGVIGRNGAGKSTLLKILSRITKPTRGRAEIHGRVGSLLEVGTGFHMELTGRENVYLNGAILGMRRSEIDRKFDEIVAFSEVERFIDTPLKHYSSGMHLRLAFAVGAFLEPEILLIDEVLAVGDAKFQKKCLGKMGEITGEGRTLLFVSHNLGMIREICTTSIVIDQGVVSFRGGVAEGLVHYGRLLADNDAEPEPRRTAWTQVEIRNSYGAASQTLARGEPFTVHARLNLETQLRHGFMALLLNGLDNTILHHRIELTDLLPDDGDALSYRIEIRVPGLWLAPGLYTLRMKLYGVQAGDGQTIKPVSEPLLLEWTGSVAGLGKALLAPVCEWIGTAEPADRPATRTLPQL
jgi:lipopolysaccharide transport system ATP-binding protein